MNWNILSLEGVATSRPSVRWSAWIRPQARVTLLLCLMYALMYLDRVNLSAAASSIKADFKLSNAELGMAFTGFSWAYRRASR